jgi:hypothetical protein
VVKSNERLLEKEVALVYDIRYSNIIEENYVGINQHKPPQLLQNWKIHLE